MGIREARTPAHWNYFLALDDDIERLSRYLELTRENFYAYSIELSRILFAAASEVDVVGKMICDKLDVTSKAKNIDQYRKKIVASYHLLAETRVLIPRFGLFLNPWEEWQKGNNPLWWKAYNNVKHHRNSHFPEASLKNALDAVAGLFVLLLFFHQEEAQAGLLNPDPRLFRVAEPFEVGRNLYEPYANIYRIMK